MPQPSLPAPAHRWAVVCLLLGLATACGFALEPHVSLTSLAMVYVLAVALAAYKLDWIGSSVCAVGAVTALNFFFVPPRWTFEVESQEHFIALGAMLVVALAISHLATGLRRETDIARLNEQRARQLQALATELANAASNEQVLALGRSALEAGFAGPCVLALTQDEAAWICPRTPRRWCATAWSAASARRRCSGPAPGAGPAWTPGSCRWARRAMWPAPPVCAPHRPATKPAREHAQALCALLGQALWRLRLNADMLQAQSEAHHQQLQSTFLAAISHDLRTPLAAIVGAASSLQTQRDKLTRAEQERLLAQHRERGRPTCPRSPKTPCSWCGLTRPGAGPAARLGTLEEIVGAVLARVRQRDPGAAHQVQRARGPAAAARRDPVLLAQLIANLLDNALKYSDGRRWS